MLACFSTNTIAQASTLAPLLLKSVEKAASQPTQALSVMEGLCAACILIKLISKIGDKDNSFQSLWNILLDMDKQIFVSEKFLSITNDDGLIYVIQLCEKLLVEYPDKLPEGKTAPLHRAVLHCVTYGTTRVRRKCLTVLKRMVGGLGGATLSRALFAELRKFLEVTKIQINTNNSNNGDQKDQNDNNSEISPHAIVECITSLCSAPGLGNEHCQLLAMDALLPSHHPAVVAVAPDLWIKVIKHLNIKPKDLVAQQAQFFRKILVQEYHTSPVSQERHCLL